jgi:hypothetical protein
MFTKEQFEALAAIKGVIQDELRKEFKEEIEQLTERLHKAEKEIERLAK